MKPRKASKDSAIVVVATANTANGIDTITMMNGATAYSGFHGLSSMLTLPKRNNILRCFGHLCRCKDDEGTMGCCWRLACEVAETAKPDTQCSFRQQQRLDHPPLHPGLDWSLPLLDQSSWCKNNCRGIGGFVFGISAACGLYATRLIPRFGVMPIPRMMAPRDVPLKMLSYCSTLSRVE